MRIAGIYKITSPVGSVYIGQSSNAYKRLCNHRNLVSIKCRKLYNSLKKYGPESHQFEIVHELPSDIEKLHINEIEKLFISQYKSSGVNMLNIKEGGDCANHSDETKELIRKITTGVKQSEETIQKRVNKNRGQKRTEEVKAKIRNSQLGKVIPVEQRMRISATKKGVPLSAEAKANVIEAIRRRGPEWFSDPVRNQKISAAKKGKKFSEEHKEKLRLAWVKRKLKQFKIL